MFGLPRHGDSTAATIHEYHRPACVIERLDQISLYGGQFNLCPVAASKPIESIRAFVFLAFIFSADSPDIDYNICGLCKRERIGPHFSSRRICAIFEKRYGATLCV